MPSEDEMALARQRAARAELPENVQHWLDLFIGSINISFVFDSTDYFDDLEGMSDA